jgi:hypothetical protein
MKSILLALTIIAVTVPPAFAQFEGANNGDARGNFTYQTKINYQPMAPSEGTAQDLSGMQGSGWGDVGTSQTTGHGGFKDGKDDHGPVRAFGAHSEDAPNPLARGGSGAAMGGPLMILGQNTYLAPANMALRTQYGNSGGGLRLPQTGLDSFVHQARMNYNADLIYGDEGTYGPPPYNHFTPMHFIERGIRSSGLTTGHPSDAPSAWDTPLKYNSMGGVIHGE